VPRERVAVSWVARGDARQRAADLAAFRARLRGLPAIARGARHELAPATRAARRAWPKPLQWTAWTLIFGTLAFGTGALASWPAWRLLGPEQAVISLSLRHAAKTQVECKPLTAEEMISLKPNMRRPVGCPRERWPVYVELLRDGRLLYRGEHAPAGLWNDGPSTVLERIVVPRGPQALTVRLRDTGRREGFDYQQEIRADLAAAQNFVIEFRADQGFVYH